MTEARLEQVHESRIDARTYLEQAKTFQADADGGLSSNEASYAAMLVPEASIEEAREATAELISLATEFVGSD
jgi:hypothetical protein